MKRKGKEGVEVAGGEFGGVEKRKKRSWRKRSGGDIARAPHSQ